MFMKSKQIRAISGNHALLKRNEIPVIGCVQIKKRKNLEGKFVIISEVIFYYENKYFDYFEFVDGRMLHYLINKNTPEYINMVYEDCIYREIELDVFVNRVKEVYVFHEMGF